MRARNNFHVNEARTAHRDRAWRADGIESHSLIWISLSSLFMLTGCLSTLDPLSEVPSSGVTVKMDFLHRPLPEIPLPNDIATRYDPTSATGRRINASMIAPTKLEKQVRELIDELDGWGVNQPITIPFTGAIDPRSILEGHRDPLYDFENDVVFLIDLDRRELVHLDLGEGNYPVILEDLNGYGEHDPRGWSNSIIFEEADEDLNGNGKLDLGEDLNGNGELDPPEDLDGDGELDLPNYLPCGVTGKTHIPCDDTETWLAPARDNLTDRADALMTFYERMTNTLILRPMKSLHERTRYAVVLTRRIRAADGSPIGSPFKSFHHLSQTDDLLGIGDLLPEGISEDEIAFAFTFTTQTLSSAWVAVREGLYGYGIQGHIGDQFPPRLTSLEPLRNVESGKFGEATNPFVMYTRDWIEPFSLIAQQLLRQDPNTRTYDVQFGAQDAVGYHVIGSFQSPQLYRRTPEGIEQSDVKNWLTFNEQSWPPDLDRVPAEATPEQIWFWLMMPAPEVRAPGPVPVVIVGHGYGSNRFESLAFAGYFAQHGMATIAIDCPSHGLGLSPTEVTIATAVTQQYGLEGFLRAANLGRAFDQDFDESADSGVDYWSAYVFHTRDVVRQCVLDHMALIRLIRSFNGERRWEGAEFDLDGDGRVELAGDFDADGIVDIGADSQISILGASLGGIISSLVASLDPEISAAIPISGGGGLGDIGLRSLQGGVREAVILRVMGQILLGEQTEEGTRVYALMPELNDDGRRDLGKLPPLKHYDSLILHNRTNGQVGCAYVQSDGQFRLSVESDVGDELELFAYRGPQLAWTEDEPRRCILRNEDAVALGKLDAFQNDVNFLGAEYAEGDQLVALSEGFGEHRASPGLRRFLGLGQLVLDGGDPASYARHLMQEPLRYPLQDQETGAHTVIVTTMGDMNVPASSGATLGRSAGLIDYLTPLPEHGGRSANQVLLESDSIEAVHSLKRHTDHEGRGVHLDIELFSEGQDVWTALDVPRSMTPLRSGLSRPDRLGGYSGAIFPYSSPAGQHGFNFPGMVIRLVYHVMKTRSSYTLPWV